MPAPLRGEGPHGNSPVGPPGSRQLSELQLLCELSVSQLLRVGEVSGRGRALSGGSGAGVEGGVATLQRTRRSGRPSWNTSYVLSAAPGEGSGRGASGRHVTFVWSVWDLQKSEFSLRSRRKNLNFLHTESITRWTSKSGPENRPGGAKHGASDASPAPPAALGATTVRATHVVSKFPEEGGEHGQGGFHARKAHLAEARAVVADEGHVHRVEHGLDGLWETRQGDSSVCEAPDGRAGASSGWTWALSSRLCSRPSPSL